MTARVHACLECGADLECTCQPARDFCSTACRDRWNNRRKTRGAELYDLYMAHRHDRTTASALGLFQAINRLASDYRAQDRQEREGRRSWRRPDAVLAERPHLRAPRFQTRAGR